MHKSHGQIQLSVYVPVANNLVANSRTGFEFYT